MIFWVTVRSGLRIFVSFFVQIFGRFLTEWGRKIPTPDWMMTTLIIRYLVCIGFHWPDGESRMLIQDLKMRRIVSHCFCMLLQGHHCHCHHQLNQNHHLPSWSGTTSCTLRTSIWLGSVWALLLLQRQLRRCTSSDDSQNALSTSSYYLWFWWQGASPGHEARCEGHLTWPLPRPGCPGQSLLWLLISYFHLQGITSTDGVFVEAIHTSTFGICSTVVEAHTNTYVNGGQAQVELF